MQSRLCHTLAFALAATLLAGCSDEGGTTPEETTDASVSTGGDATSDTTTGADTTSPTGGDVIGGDTGATATAADTSADTTPDIGASCGDGVLDPGEDCDDGAANSNTEPNACRTDCTAAACGDGVIDGAESCDGAATRLTCIDGGFGGGTIACASDCTAHVYDGCGTCGDGVAEGDDPTAGAWEACDGADLRASTCVSEGFAYGEIACAADCALDTSACVAMPAVCGNDTREDAEVCDGADLAGITCQSEGFTGGTIACATDCTGVDTSNCYTCGNGVQEPGEACDDGNTDADFTCSSTCQSTCDPFHTDCDGDTARFCDLDGETIITESCDPLQGTTCDPNAGQCTGSCAPQALGASYFGCDYYPTVTANVTAPAFDFAVAVANTSANTVTATVTQGANTVSTTMIAPNDVAVIALPWVDALKGGSEAGGNAPLSASVFATDGAYRLRTTEPVTVYQFSPLQYGLPGANCNDFNLNTCSFTNDASILLPQHVWGNDYLVAGWGHWDALNWSAFMAITASEDNTMVTVNAANGTYRAGVTGIDAAGNGTIVLNQGDVVELFTLSSGTDPTGSRITSDKPIQVISGHQCSNVPFGIAACDHLEETIYPVTALSTTYALAAPLLPALTPKARVVRIVATQANTTLSYDPPVTGAPTSIASANGFIEFTTVDNFVVTASSPVIVAQLQQGQNAGGGTGDPALTIQPAIAQARTDYLFHAPTNYDANFVNIAAPTGTTVTLDGNPVTGWTTMGGSGFDVARVQLSNAGTGNHTISATNPVGIDVYGYGQFTSYWYPGGSDVEEL